MRRGERAFNLPSSVLWLSVVLLAVHGIRAIISPDADETVVLALAFIPARYGEAAEFLPGGWAARFWSPLSYAFLHADILHLVVNLVWMASFGSALARRFGTVRFLLISAVSAIAGAGAFALSDPGDAAIVVGASGAISGMMAATARFAFSPGGPLGGGGNHPLAYLQPPTGIIGAFRNSRVLVFLGVWLAVNFLFGLTTGLMPGVQNPIAWQAHLGGFAAGLFLFRLFDPIPAQLADTGRFES
jgi:membrane associated rhomboid family serine protease